MTSFLGSLALALKEALDPLADSLSSLGAFQALLRRLGYGVSSVDDSSMAAIQAAFAIGDLFKAAEALADELEKGTGDDLKLAADLAGALVPIIDAVRKLATTPPTGLPYPLDQSGFWQDAPLALVDDLLLGYLERKQPIAFGAIVFLGIAEVEQVPAAAPGRITYERRRLYWDRLGTLLSDPEAHLRSIYHWNDPAEPFAHRRLWNALQRLLWSAGVPARLRDAPSALITSYYASTNPALPAVRELAVPFAASESGAMLGVSLLPIPEGLASTEPPSGFLLSPLVSGSFAGDADGGGDADGAPIFSLDLAGGFELDGGLGLEVRPDSIKLVTGTGSINAILSLSGRPSKPWLLVGSPGSHRVEVGGVLVAAGVRGAITDPEFVLRLGTGDGANPPTIRLVIQLQEGDGFLRKVFGDKPQSLDFGGAITWSSKTGLALSGKAGIALVIPLHVSLGGALELETLYVDLGVSGSGAALTVALDARATLGPVAASVQRLGVKLALVPVPSGGKTGTFGDLDLQFGFKPPSGIGIAIDAGPVSGGGFISFDPDNGRYAGVLALSLYSVKVTAIGLLDTKLPDGKPGFSFLILIAVEFTPIQLGFGFTLNGVGGLCGINRTLVTQALQDGVRKGSLDSILFPRDPIKRAAQIITDLRMIFPPAEGRYVFGPVVRLGWGLWVEAELGVILELPWPVRIAILGKLDATFPAKEAAVVELHLDVAGIIDFEKKLFSMDASLHDSRVALFNIAGDMAMRLTWGDDPSFALSLGGFNPHFQPPVGFPSLKRLSISLDLEGVVHLSLEAYFALTSNSLQFGAHLALHVTLEVATIEGFLSFDALFIFSPFSFLIEFEAGLSVKLGSLTLLGIHLAGALSGPTPWHLTGQASLTVLFFEIAVSVDVTFGDDQKNALPATDPWPALKAALQDARNWEGLLPPKAASVVSFSAPEGKAAPVLVDPVGAVSLRQKVLPLNRQITRFNEATPTGPDHYTLTKVTLGGEVTPYEPLEEDFAPAQYRDLPDDEKLSGPSFVKMQAGFTVASEATRLGAVVSLPVEYLTTTYGGAEAAGTGAALAARASGTRYALAANRASCLSGLGPSARASLSATGMGKYAPAATGLVQIEDEAYTIVAWPSKAPTTITAATSKGLAQAALAEYLSGHPEARGTLRVINVHDINASGNEAA
ncbi:DUF6603 domain-containing protein [Sorangium sp. So ce124]|uniref:DUF6603 domain-containing protein n=1 Tax=Sorangium sp. So ce124 TaxID=3133280 RepID=UPI003F5DFD15